MHTRIWPGINTERITCNK